jgi:hypothetical protein
LEAKAKVRSEGTDRRQDPPRFKAPATTTLNRIMKSYQRCNFNAQNLRAQSARYCVQVTNFEATLEIQFSAKMFTSHVKHSVLVSFGTACTSPTAIEPSLSPHTAPRTASFVALTHINVAVRVL